MFWLETPATMDVGAGWEIISRCGLRGKNQESQKAREKAHGYGYE